MAVYLKEMVDSRLRCPESEILAAYVDGRLSLVERARLESHLALCPTCIAVVAGVVKTLADLSAAIPANVSEPDISRESRRSVLGALVAAAAVLAVLALPPSLQWLDRAGAPGELDGARTIVAKLTDESRQGRDSADPLGSAAARNDHILLTASKISESFGQRQTPSDLHALGVSLLLAGRHDEAAESLVAASREQPSNARYLSDVSAVQLERARLGLRPDDLPRALASADRARRLDPSLREAWFNRALALTALSLNDQAKAAWTDYLARDNASPWADEARTRLAAITKPTAAAAWDRIQQRLSVSIDAAVAEEALRTQTTEARAFVENDLLPKWSAAVEAGNDGSAEIDSLRVMADAFARVTGDALYHDVVLSIDRATSEGRSALLALARAHRRYESGSRAFAEDQLGSAKVGFTAALQELTATRSPLAVRAGIELGALAHISGAADEALARLGAGLTTARARGYLYGAARCTWFQGLVAFGQGRLGDAQAHYEDTLATFEQMGDAEQIASAHNLLASLHGYLGDEKAAWTHREKALPALSVTRSGRFRYFVLSGAAAAARRQDPEVGLVFQDALVASAQAWGNPGPLAESLSQRAGLFVSLGRMSDAREALALARDNLQSVKDPGLRQYAELPLLIVESDLLRHSDPAQAVAAATRAADIVQARRDRLRLAQIELRRAKANIVWGRLDEAEASLIRGIRAFDEERSSVAGNARISTLDESWQLFDTAIHLAIKKKDYARAFALTERARSLSVESTTSSNRTLGEIQNALDSDEALLMLNQFDDELAVWLIRRDGTSVVTRPVTRRIAETLVTRQQAEIRHEAIRPGASADLFNEIVRSAQDRLRGIRRLTIVPDTPYHDVAFAALWDASSRRFLIENVTLSTAPSASAHVATASPERPTGAGRRNALVVGGPDGGAEAIARTVAAVYQSPSLLTGAAATRDRLFANASNRSIVHLSARTVSNQAYPSLSRVVLADEPGRRHSGGVLGREVAGQPLSRAHLVVLDEVENGGRTRGEGTLTLARAFQTAGVPAVLATLPGAEHAALQDLIVGFHRHVSSGMVAEEALATIQRNVLQSSGRRLGAWSALVLYGSER
ncbi:MAG: CHAT domain-containing protein [Cyanobacteria bacterium]|nr:CHAT domain-containing protein [Cyanobacteriota bacterium]